MQSRRIDRFVTPRQQPPAAGGVLRRADLRRAKPIGRLAGVDLTAFQLVDRIGLQQATDFVLGSYVDLSCGLWRIPVTASAGSILGMLLLGLARGRARDGAWRPAAVVRMGFHPAPDRSS
ncbi:hypothetical protein [Saccharopolyspora antimicrobica]|uniref:hypothetical protein n=1 Tax=Saccharopolyspora antimicrobica TaxID=455193 RepID=UPI0011607854|nr:hypothetical protein [Saccharopolyspora antimicrobica]